MKKAKIIFNPSSGSQNAEKKIDHLSKLMLDDGYTVNKFITSKKDDAMYETIKASQEDWDIIVASGGDGTVNEVAKGIIKGDRKIPLAILSSGTVNDFANYMNIPKNIPDFYEMIKRENTKDVDIGKTEDEYFVNVAAGGLLTSVAHQVTPDSKMVLGRLAYYLAGLKELTTQSIEHITIDLESKEFNKEGCEALLFIISNSSSVGGFENIAPHASVSDGLMDVLLIERTDVQNLANIFFHIRGGRHIDHPNVKYFKTNKLKIDSKDEVIIDVDGEFGGRLPQTFEILPKALKLII